MVVCSLYASWSKRTSPPTSRPLPPWARRRSGDASGHGQERLSGPRAWLVWGVAERARRRSGNASGHGQEHLGGPRAWLVWGVAVALYFVAVFHRMGLGVAALEAERRYHVAAGALSVFTAVQLGVYLAMQVPVGLAADRIGPRRSLAAGMA